MKNLFQFPVSVNARFVFQELPERDVAADEALKARAKAAEFVCKLTKSELEDLCVGSAINFTDEDIAWIELLLDFHNGENPDAKIDVKEHIRILRSVERTPSEQKILKAGIALLSDLVHPEEN